MNDMELLARYLVQQQAQRVDHQQMHRHAISHERGGLRRSARLIAQQIRSSRRHAG